MSESALAPVLRAAGYVPRDSKPGLWMRVGDDGVRWFADFRDAHRGRFYAFDPHDKPHDAAAEERRVRLAADQSQRRLTLEP